MFFGSILTLIIAYTVILHHGIRKFDVFVYAACLLGTIGTILFFAALSGIVLQVVQHDDRIYLKQLTSVTVRQISEKIKANFITMSVVCLAFFITITVLSSGIGMSSVLAGDLGLLYPFEAQIYGYQTDDLETSLKEDGIDLSGNLISWFQYRVYIANIKTKDLISPELQKELTPDIRRSLAWEGDKAVQSLCIRNSDFNTLMEYQGNKPIYLADDEYCIFTKYDEAQRALSTYMDSHSIKIKGKEYRGTAGGALIRNINMVGLSDDIAWLIIPDEASTELEDENGSIVLDLRNRLTHEEISRYTGILSALNNSEGSETLKLFVDQSTAQNGRISISLIVTYLAIYCGMVFLITGSSIVAIQQLSESADNVYRYILLHKLGASTRIINKTLIMQIAIYFILPLALAVIHSIVGITVANRIITEFGTTGMARSTIMAAFVILIVYGAYFFATYRGAKSMIQKTMQ